MNGWDAEVALALRRVAEDEGTWRWPWAVHGEARATEEEEEEGT